MASDYKECLDLVLRSEGGWTGANGLAGDPGGETNLGVTKAVWEEYVGHPVTTMKNLTKDDVAPLRAVTWDCRVVIIACCSLIAATKTGTTSE